MKKILFLALSLISSNLYGQIENDSLKGVKISERTIYSENDTIPIIVNLGNKKKQDNTLWLLNGEQINEQVATTINPNGIEELKVEKINGKGEIHIRTKEEYTPNFISLNALKLKYLDLTDSIPVLFILDEKIINLDYDEFKVDEKYIFKIEVQSVENSKEQLNVNVIRLTSRTKKNIEKANTIKLQGNGF